MGFQQEIKPFEGVGEVRFGTPRAIVREMFGHPNEIIRKPNWNSQLTDFYIALGWSFTYDPDGLLAAVELFGPARISARGVELLGRPAEQVLGELRSTAGAGANPNDPYGFPEIGVSIALRSAGLGEPLQSVSAFASTNAPEPEFFEASPQFVQRPVEIGRGQVGTLRTPCDRQSMRSVLGEGMGFDWYGRPVDVFFQGVVVEYDASGLSTRVVANGIGPTIQGLPVQVTRETSYSACLRILTDQGFDCVEGEAEIRLPGKGVSLLMARGGDPTLPIAAIAVESLLGRYFRGLGGEALGTGSPYFTI